MDDLSQRQILHPDKAMVEAHTQFAASSSNALMHEEQESTWQEDLLVLGGGSGLGLSLASLVIGLMHDEPTFMKVGEIGLPLSCLAMAALIYIDWKSKRN